MKKIRNLSMLGIVILTLGFCFISVKAETLVATSSLHLPHNGNVYSSYRKFSGNTQSLVYIWDSIEPGSNSSDYATFIVNLQVKTLLGLDSKTVMTSKGGGYATTTSTTVDFKNIGKGTYRFHHSSDGGGWNKSTGKFDSDYVRIYTE